MPQRDLRGVRLFFTALNHLFLQEKYKRDQEKLQEEWLKAQQDIGTTGDREEVTRMLSFV